MDQGFSANGGEMPAVTHASRDPRRAVGLPASLTRGTGTVVPVTIRDLSYNGCGILSAEPLAPGETMPLTVDGRGTIRVRVRWCEGDAAGLEFEADAELTPDESDRVERVSPRTLARCQVMVRNPGGPMWSAEVSDVSPEGCRIGWVSRPRVGDAMWVKFENLEAMGARVCWVEGPMAGLQFTRPIHPAVFDLLLVRMRGQ